MASIAEHPRKWSGAVKLRRASNRLYQGMAALDAAFEKANNMHNTRLTTEAKEGA